MSSRLTFASDDIGAPLAGRADVILFLISSRQLLIAAAIFAPLYSFVSSGQTDN
jgi:hypothetical protein